MVVVFAVVLGSMEAWHLSLCSTVSLAVTSCTVVIELCASSPEAMRPRPLLADIKHAFSVAVKLFFSAVVFVDHTPFYPAVNAAFIYVEITVLAFRNIFLSDVNHCVLRGFYFYAVGREIIRIKVSIFFYFKQIIDYSKRAKAETTQDFRRKKDTEVDHGLPERYRLERHD